MSKKNGGKLIPPVLAYNFIEVLTPSTPVADVIVIIASHVTLIVSGSYRNVSLNMIFNIIICENIIQIQDTINKNNLIIYRKSCVEWA